MFFTAEDTILACISDFMKTLNAFTWRRLNIKQSEAWNVDPVKKSHIKTINEGIFRLDVNITVREKLFLVHKM